MIAIQNDWQKELKQMSNNLKYLFVFKLNPYECQYWENYIYMPSCHTGLRMKVSVSLLGQDELEHIALVLESLQTTDIPLYHSLIRVALAGMQS